MLMSAKEFCQATGWPLKTIRRLCRTGQLECWQQGRVYLLEKEATLIKLELFKQRPCPAGVSDVPRQRRSKLIALPGRLAVDTHSSASSAEAAEIIRKVCYSDMKEISRYQYDPEKFAERVRERQKWEHNGDAEDD